MPKFKDEIPMFIIFFGFRAEIRYKSLVNVIKEGGYVFKKVIHTLLLVSLFINITHATIISFVDRCEHQTLCEYVIEIDYGNKYGDLCDIHHMFHFSAIPIIQTAIIPNLSYSVIMDYYQKQYMPPLLEPSCRPPIA